MSKYLQYKVQMSHKRDFIQALQIMKITPAQTMHFQDIPYVAICIGNYGPVMKLARSFIETLTKDNKV